MEKINEPKKHHFTLPSAFTILFFCIIVIALLTWIIPAGTYSTDKAGNIIAGTYREVAKNPQGIWDVFMAPILGMIGNKQTTGAIEISVFILVIGGFLGVVNKTGALNTGIQSIVTRYTGKEKRLIVILMVIFAIGGSTYGMGEETMAFFPLLIPIMMGVGYDALVPVGIILLSTRIGDLASTVNPFSTGVASAIVNISPGVGLFSRIILLIITTTIIILFVIHYAETVKKDPTKSLIYDQREKMKKEFNVDSKQTVPEKMTTRQTVVMWIFGLTFGIMIVGLVPWTSINKNWTFFETFTKWLTGNSILGTIFGTDIVPLGSWYFNEISMLFIFMSVVVMFVAKMKESDFIDAFVKGMSDLLSVAIIVAVARGIQVTMNSGLITGTILHFGESTLTGMPKPLFAILAFIFFCVLSILIPSSSGLAAATMGIMGSLAVFSHVHSSVVVSAFQAATGIVTGLTPTSAVLMASLALAHVSLITWYKWVWKPMLVLFLVVFAFLTIVSII
ncbi:YfcC family protein [Companilactobacillus halodurans]|uniref:YfcC family protein n=1 Tax=Companilactobacillus halodurans TaxID=2584183 RepID=A0A5P0ZLS2_9LACO|nr:YfcC family protein [Companilactobacillus halodurans]MQS75195.1 YfcC family protein [Companilactobacillus halodurans]MQS98499.1 YfcC family protein [Companilactobacillus halodurans]